MSYLRHVPQDFRKADSTWLSRCTRDVYSQFGEDGIIEKIYEIIGMTSRYCVEFGAWDGVKYSNCRNLLLHGDWSGLLIEGDPERYRALLANYENHAKIATLNSYVDLEANALDNLLEGAQAPSVPDLVSIDVDGIDWHIWNSLKRYRPRVVIVEFNPCIPNDVAFVQDEDRSINQGSSLLALIGLAKLNRYELIATTTTNAFFVVDDEFPKFNISDNGIYAMHSCAAFETKLIQLYDGTLKITGYTRMHWKDWPLSEDALQVVPPALRRFEG